MAYAVITRELDAASPYIATLATLGLEVVTMPVTRTAPPHDPAALAAALARGGHVAIVVASARAAEALVAARGDAALPEVWAVGPATARALAAAGIAAIVPGAGDGGAGGGDVDGCSPARSDGAALAAALIAARPVAGQRILVPRAEAGRDELIDALRRAGAEVEIVVAYRTVATPPDHDSIARGRALLVGGDAAVCAVFAPSQVTALAALVPLAGVAARFVAIGETTAHALRQAGVAVAAVATQPTPEGLAEAVSAVYPLPS